jgi:predicted ATP-grasp superfamily ATP-dependent carboligase
MRYLLENKMRYDVEIDLEDLGIGTDDLISLAVLNGDTLYDEDDLECRIEEALAEDNAELKDTIKSLEEDVIRLNNEVIAKAVDVDAIAIFVATALRVEAVGIADCIRNGDYGV